mmetsp:Transcript_15465/g.65259  ORF Transcript_15465/g.65259 Transcript_15465/m.65259 type:complete len:241 (+) Transcript_15465:143-865(+)
MTSTPYVSSAGSTGTARHVPEASAEANRKRTCSAYEASSVQTCNRALLVCFFFRSVIPSPPKDSPVSTPLRKENAPLIIFRSHSFNRNGFTMRLCALVSDHGSGKYTQTSKSEPSGMKSRSSQRASILTTFALRMFAECILINAAPTPGLCTSAPRNLLPGHVLAISTSESPKPNPISSATGDKGESSGKSAAKSNAGSGFCGLFFSFRVVVARFGGSFSSEEDPASSPAGPAYVWTSTP